jgi:outer membrane protein OmpU
MKKALLATSAIIAAGVIAAPAIAAEKKAAGPIALKLGGYFTLLAVHTSQDDGAGQPGANLHDNMITREAEVSFSGSTTLDNGVSVGVDVQLEAETCGDQVDESYIWFKGSFGQVVLGAENGAGNKSFRGSSVPAAGFISTWTSNYRLYAGGGNAASGPFRSDVSGDSEKITYWSPKMSGFQAGVSYTFDSGEIGSSYAGQEADNTAAQQSNIMELGATYSGNTGKDGASYAVSGAYIKGDNESAGGVDQKVWALGADVTFSGITIAGGYGKNNQATTGSNTDLVDWNLGIKSSSGPWSYGISYSNFDAEAGAGLGSDERDHWIAAASYAFGPGISLSAAIENVKLEDNLNAAANENNATSIMLGTALFF